MRRFVVCGEALVDLVPDSSVATPRASGWRALSAGGPLNTAVALARLGVPTWFLGRFGSDAFAHQLRAHLAAAGVNQGLSVTTDEATSLAVVSLDAAGQASYAFHFGGTANVGWRPDETPVLAADDWLHIASLALILSPGADVLRAWVGRGGSPCSLDVNVRPTVLPDAGEYWARLEPWLEAVGARGGGVKGSDEDFAFLAGVSGLPRDPAGIVATLRERYGLAWAVLTLGPDGAVAHGPDGPASVPGRPVEVVDTIGAGDTFMAGLLDGLIARDLPLTPALERGVAAATWVCAREGADPPTADELDAERH